MFNVLTCERQCLISSRGTVAYTTWWGPSVFNAPICATEVIINNDCPLDNLRNFRPTWIRTHVVRNFWHQVAGLQMQATTSAYEFMNIWILYEFRSWISPLRHIMFAHIMLVISRHYHFIVILIQNLPFFILLGI